MKILLINPPWYKKVRNIWRNVASTVPALGIGYIASFLEREKLQVEILDFQAEEFTEDGFENKLKDYNPDIVGVTSTTPIFNNALNIISITRRIIPAAKIVVGGVHPTIFAEDILKNKNVDFVVRGEGEITFVELVKNLSNPVQVHGISYRINGNIVNNPERQLIENLDNIPFPAYHLLPVEKYKPALGNYKRMPVMSMITTRGCPGKCTFCFRGILGTRMRTRSPENIVEEIRFLAKNYGIREISFYDDTFTLFKNNVKKFCEILLNKNIAITWSCMSRVDFVDRETLNLMKRAGCHQICYGIESGNESILENINKRTSLEKAKTAIAITREAKIDTRLAFMLGSPGETVETMEETIRFAIENSPDLVQFNITTPYPGTDMFEWAKKNDYLLTYDWDKYDLATCVMNLPTIAPETVERYYHKAYQKFFLRPSYILKRIGKIRSLDDILIGLKAIKTIFRISVDMEHSRITTVDDLKLMEPALNYTKWIIRLINGFIGDRILEIGAGIGNTTRFLKEKTSVVVLDKDNKCVELLNTKFGNFENIEVIAGDISDESMIYLKKHKFDTVLCINTLEHIEDDVKALNNMYNILESGGVIILVVPAMDFVYGTMDKIVGHFRRYTKNTLKNKVQGTGFKIEKQIYFNSIGLIGWYLNNKLLKISRQSKSQIFIFDRIIVPVLSRVENIIRPLFGQSLLCIGRKTGK